MSKATALVVFAIAISAYAADPSQDVDVILGQAAKVTGEVHRYGWPRSDLRVKVGSVRIEPALALGSWAAFSDNMVMGDLVLKTTELDSVVHQLHAGGFEIAAIHNHLSGESPSVVYLHYAGHGDPPALARTLKAALGTTSTPMYVGSPAAAVEA